MDKPMFFTKTANVSVTRNTTTITTPVTYIKSTAVQAYPCGRRRSVDNKGNVQIPFDPEARLNTEANNRKHSSLNGYTQTYLVDWSEKELSFSLAGYLFQITLDTDLKPEYKFAKAVLSSLGRPKPANKIYANILLEDTQLFAGFQSYFTDILRDQTTLSAFPSEALDLLVDSNTATAVADNYYFSGLSFSTVPLTDKKDEARSIDSLTMKRTYGDNKEYTVKQTLVSLCLMEKDATGTWKIYEPAKLPKIEHGQNTNSVIIQELATDILNVNSTGAITNIAAQGSITITGDGNTKGIISAPTFIQDAKKVPIIDLVSSTDINEKPCWQLQFTGVNK